MTALLSAISGQFTKAWILGALFPAAIFVFLFLVVVAPLFPPDLALVAPSLFGDDWDVLSVTFATLVLSGLLYCLDTPLVQFYEGYPWQRSLLGRWRTAVHRERLRTLRRRSAVFFVLDRDPGTARGDDVSTARGDVLRRLSIAFPDEEGLVLPTRLGNVLRAFERYPSVQYRMDAIYFWPRLVALIQPAHATAIGDARISFIFLLTLSFLATVLGAVTAAAGLVYLPPDPLTHAVLPAIVFFLASGWLYLRAVDAGEAWGHLVKGAFDLYRGELLEKLGYRQEPRTREEERDLWDRITQQIIFGDKQVALDSTRPHVDYDDPPQRDTAVRAEPEDVPLELTRAVEGPVTLRELRLVVVVRNRDTKRTATKVVLTDTLPEGMAYRWDSARVNGASVPVVGTGPYEFHLGDVMAKAVVTLTYTACATQLEN
jgi:uncharacterized repeat protein (TIGR01451 family)